MHSNRNGFCIKNIRQTMRQGTTESYVQTLIVIMKFELGKKSLITCLILCPFFGFAQPSDEAVAEAETDSISPNDTLTIWPDDPVVAMMDSMMRTMYFQEAEFQAGVHYDIPADSVPKYSDEYYEKQVADMDVHTPFEMRYNETVGAFINLYANRRRKLTSVELGLTQVYFPMYEQLLDKHDMPLELKYLSIVESGLNPRAKSRAGAVGLWQFMYPTGKMMGLEVTSYIDERKDPYKATDAACRYLKFLYGMYDDWSMALAAYNAGPGNVNRAIRRSGGKKTYWEIRPFLPKETRSYVPAFIAVNYVFSHAKEHNLKAVRPNYRYFEYDTVRIKQTTHFDQITEVLCMDMEELEYLNPQYKDKIIPNPENDEMILYLPYDIVGDFVVNEQTIYNYVLPEPVEPEIEEIYHIVRSGEYAGLIAQKYRCTVNDLKEWNNLRNYNLHIGQKLIVRKAVVKSSSAEANGSTRKEDAVASSGSQKAQNASKDDGTYSYKYHTIQSGDTLWDIANKYDGVTVDLLKKWNQGINENDLKRGQKIKIGTKSAP